MALEVIRCKTGHCFRLKVKYITEVPNFKQIDLQNENMPLLV